MTATVMIHVVLSSLPPGTDPDPPLLDARLAAVRGGQPHARLQAGWLTAISIRLNVGRSTIVGRLGAKVCRFAFGAPAHREHLERLVAASGSIPAIVRGQPRSEVSPSLHRRLRVPTASRHSTAAGPHPGQRQTQSLALECIVARHPGWRPRETRRARRAREASTQLSSCSTSLAGLGESTIRQRALELFEAARLVWPDAAGLMMARAA